MYRVVGIGLTVHAVALGLMCVPGARTLALIGVGMQAASIAVLFPSIFKAMAQAFPADRQPVLHVSVHAGVVRHFGRAGPLVSRLVRGIPQFRGGLRHGGRRLPGRSDRPCFTLPVAMPGAGKATL